MVMNPTLVAMGFSAYFLLIVISYILLSNPDIDPLRGILLLTFSFVAVAVPSCYVVVVRAEMLTKLLSGSIAAVAALVFFAWLFLYILLKRVRPAKGLVSSRGAEEAVYITVAAYGALQGAYLLVANTLLVAAAFTLVLLHLFICRGSVEARSTCEKYETFLGRI
jgi:hypothetical protein